MLLAGLYGKIRLNRLCCNKNSKITAYAYNAIGVIFMEAILAAVILFFALWGLSDCLRAVAVKALVPKDKIRRFVVPVNDIEGYYDLMSELELIRWHNERNPVVLAVDNGMDEQTLELCKKVAEETPFMILCKPEEAAYIIRQ